MEIFRTAGTCSRQIIFSVKDDILTTCKFVNGCLGNAQGITRLSEGQNINTIIEKLSGIKCKQGTSCPDQLAKALIGYKEKMAQKAQKEQEKLERQALAAANKEESSEEAV